MYRQIARNKRWGILLNALFCIAVVGLGLFSAWVVGEGLLAQRLGSHPPVAERMARLTEIGRGF